MLGLCITIFIRIVYLVFLELVFAIVKNRGVIIFPDNF